MIPEVLPRGGPGEDVTNKLCEFAFRWRISHELALKLLDFQAIFPHPVQIVSGWRSAEEQANTAGGARDDLSTHRSCPATGADLQVIGWMKTNAPRQIKALFKSAAETAGMRVGGGSSRDPETGLPSDWNHVDLGPRR